MEIHHNVQNLKPWKLFNNELKSQISKDISDNGPFKLTEF